MENNTFFADVSCLGKIRISGKSAPEFVRVMTTAELRRIETPGEATMSLVLNAEGDILDVVMIARTGEREYMLICHPETSGELAEWLQAHALITNKESEAVFEDLAVENRTDHVAAIALYGPRAQMVLHELSGIDISAELGDTNLTLITIGELKVMLVRWPFLRAHGQEQPLMAEGYVFEVYLPAKASDEFKEILLGYEEINPESYEDYVEKRRTVSTWFGPAEEPAYIKPTSDGLKALMRAGNDFVGAKALVKMGHLIQPMITLL